MSLKELLDAIEGDDMKVTNLLDRMDVSAVNERSEENEMTALDMACYKGNVQTVARLLAIPGIHVNVKNKFGCTPLHLACMEGNDQTVALLLANPDIHVNARDNEGFTPINYACVQGNDQKVARLLAIPGIHVNVQANDGSTPLHTACWKDNDQTVALLLSNPGIQVNAQDTNGETPLHLASSKGNDLAVARLLATPGIHVNVKNIGGWTPVMAAAGYRMEESFKLLLHDHRVNLDFGINDELFLEKMEDLSGTGRSEENRKYLDLIREERSKRENVCKKKDEESTRKQEKRKEKINWGFCLAKDMQNHKDFENVDDILKFIEEEDSNSNTSKKNSEQVESSKRNKRKNKKGIKMPTPNHESDKKVDTVDKLAQKHREEKDEKHLEEKTYLDKKHLEKKAEREFEREKLTRKHQEEKTQQEFTFAREAEAKKQNITNQTEKRNDLTEELQSIVENPPTDEKANAKDYQMDDTNSQKSEVTTKGNPRSSTKSNVADYTDYCWSCSKPKTEVKLYTCKGCKRAKYCSEECIACDWEEHANWCLKKQEKREKESKNLAVNLE